MQIKQLAALIQRDVVLEYQCACLYIISVRSCHGDLQQGVWLRARGVVYRARVCGYVARGVVYITRGVVMEQGVWL